MAKFVAYYRCSTQKQFSSHLGLEGQQASVLRFLNGRDHELLAQYTEVESGRHADRPRLAEALAYAKRHRATLVIARLDRLARSVAFVATLMEAGVPFVACDLVDASPLTLHIMAAVAEAEAKAISERTVAAMAAARARGVRLGNTVNLGEAQRLARESNIKNANERAANLLPIIRQIAAGGVNSVHRVAEELNRRGIRTARNAAWHGTTVSNLIKRTGFDNLQSLALTAA